ncbi:MAG: cytochrome c oxidase subunit [Acidimicrobiaceae bacterium]|jgi:cytochrome c oxidase subunit 2|nr:cytochrome c oxidase subunit [Acidimicrobiaceae bacterium]MDQ1444948.1 cytochrome c oxidase subunit [Acidimicrobiaceae bacterium]
MATLVAVLLGACGKTTMPQDALDPQGPVARKLDHLISPVFIVAGVFFVLVQFLTLFFAVRYRRRSEDEAPVQVHGNARLELAWTIVPAVILFAVAVGTLTVIADINRPAKGADVVHVDVIGHQWWWEFHYPTEGVTTANELHVPVGRLVAITLTSKDVIHSFWPPKLAGKIDAVPGRLNHMSLQADKPGTYYGQCAEFCGMAHADMRLRVVAHSAGDWAKWVAANTATPRLPIESVEAKAAAGSTLFRQKGCASCHTVEGYSKGTVGPNLSHLQQRKVFAGAIFEMNDENLRKWLRNPPKEKPGSIMPNLNLSEDEITNLIAYLDTLK